MNVEVAKTDKASIRCWMQRQGRSPSGVIRPRPGAWTKGLQKGVHQGRRLVKRWSCAGGLLSLADASLVGGVMVGREPVHQFGRWYAPWASGVQMFRMSLQKCVNAECVVGGVP